MKDPVFAEYHKLFREVLYNNKGFVDEMMRGFGIDP